MTNARTTIDALTLTKQLIAEPSVTPNDVNCQALLACYLIPLGFKITHFDHEDVSNLWAQKGSAEPLFVFAGHTDVVPPGPLDAWHSPPFVPTIRDGKLYGRGAADMKGSLAAMVAATQQFLAKHPNHLGSIAFLITSDEEGPALNGTQHVLKQLAARKQAITWCLVGEPSSEHHLGDTIKIGRRGSLNGELTVTGKQGHIAYPHLADNPIHRALSVLDQLATTKWDGDKHIDDFPATSFQFSNIHSGTGADNVIPNHLVAQFNIRYSPAVTAESLQKHIVDLLNKTGLTYDISWRHSGEPFLTASGTLIKATEQAIYDITKQKPKRSTAGGTSDGRFIAKTGCELVEFGPINASIHQINEHVLVDDLEKLTHIYEQLLTHLLVAPA